MIRWFTDLAGHDAATLELEPMREVVEKHLAAQERSTGYCCACRTIAAFRVGPEHPGQWLNLREAFVCDGCGLNGRGRMMLLLLRSAIGEGRRSTLLFERVTPFFGVASREFPDVEGCEFLAPDLEPGSVHQRHGIAIRHEDMMRLSCSDGGLDLIVHGDVLEHVPDFRAALRECARSLCRGGRLIFTAPFFQLQEHLVRAELVRGEIVHHLEPAYHGNPLSADGSLVFTHFGRPLLQDIREAGFRTVEIGVEYDPFQGIVSTNHPFPDGQMWPVAFRATK